MKKQQHPIAAALEAIIRQRLLDKKSELAISDDALGTKTFGPLGYGDVQKKVNNLLRGQKSMSLAEFYILCEGLELQPDRIFTAALDDALCIPVENKNFRKIGGCLVLQKPGQLPNYETLLCPECKESLTANNDIYICPLCKYSTNKHQTDEAIARDKARYGIRYEKRPQTDD